MKRMFALLMLLGAALAAPQHASATAALYGYVSNEVAVCDNCAPITYKTRIITGDSGSLPSCLAVQPDGESGRVSTEGVTLGPPSPVPLARPEP